MELFGRGKLYTPYRKVTADNVKEFLRGVLKQQSKMGRQADYLYDYYRGKQDILNRIKEVRPEITNKVVCNLPAFISDFDVGYLLFEPIQYVFRGAGKEDSDKRSADLELLNRYMEELEKPALDKSVAEWNHNTGTAYRVVLPKQTETESDECPFNVFTQDCRTAAIAYCNSIAQEEVAFLYYVDVEDTENKTKKRVFSIWTDNEYFELETGVSFVGNDFADASAFEIVRQESNPMGTIPAVEYPLNDTRIGCYERVIGLIDAMNTLLSNSVDNVEETVQAFMRLHNVDMDAELLEKFKEMKILAYRDISPTEKAEIDYISPNLNQAGTQSLIDSIYEHILTICSIPNRVGGSGGDNGIAVVYRNGWESASTVAKGTELTFKQSERKFLRKVLRICRMMRGMELEVSDIDIRFTRRNYENIGEKANVLNMMLDNPKIHPQLAFVHSGMFADPQHAYKLSAEYYEQTKADQLSELEAEVALLTAKAKQTANQDEEETDTAEEPTENGGEA